MQRGTFSTLAIAAVVLVAAYSPVRSAADRTYEDMKMLVEVINLIKDNYVQEMDTKKLVYGAASGMVRVLDPFSQFLEPDAHKDMKTETEGEFGGLGIRIAIRDNILTVITPLPGTPAYRQGVLPGDKIIKIDGDTTQDITIENAVKKLRGAPGSKITIMIGREGEKELKEFILTREVIKIQTIRSKMLSDGSGYIRLTEFTKDSASDMEKALKQLKAQGMKNVIIDLRNNPGGLLNVAADTCRLFIGGNKLVVYTEGRRQPRQEFRAESKGAFESIPMAVLINRGSASGSEIFAGCMQDYRRAILIGMESFGKGSVQSVIPLADGSGLRLTTAKYYTPSGRTFHRDEKTGKGGISPDITIEVNRETEIKLQQQEEEVFGQLPKKDPKEKSKDGKDKDGKDDKVKDEALDRALELLKVRDILSRAK